MGIILCHEDLPTGTVVKIIGADVGSVWMDYIHILRGKIGKVDSQRYLHIPESIPLEGVHPALCIRKKEGVELYGGLIVEEIDDPDGNY